MAPLKEKVIASAIHKSNPTPNRHWGKSRRTQYAGYLTPHEVVVLFELGCQDSQGQDKRKSRRYIRNLEYMKKGDCTSNWFYFYPSSEKLTKLFGGKPTPKGEI